MKKKNKSFWCIIGFHKLKYTYKFMVTSALKCTRENCGAKFIEGDTHTGLIKRSN